jgi:HEAT repeat protein
MTQQTGSMQVAGPEEAIAELVREPGNPDGQVRWSAAYALADIGEPAAAPLIEALKDKRAVVRRRAVTALGRVGAARFTEQLASPLHDEDWRVRLATAFVLANLENERSDALIEEALDDEESIVKNSARLLVEKRREMGR